MPKAITIGLINQKGGVAKSTLSVAIAAILSQRGCKTLVIDNDPQSNASVQVGIDLEGQLFHAQEEGDSEALADLLQVKTIAEVYEGAVRMEEAILETDYPNLDLVPSTIRLAEVEMVLPSRAGADYRLKAAVERVKSSYDFIILDSPPNLGKLALNVLNAADYYIVPVNGVWSLRSIASIMNATVAVAEYSNHQSRCLGIVMTMVERARIFNSIRNLIGEKYGELLFETEMRKAAVVREAEASGMPLPLFAPNNPVSEDLHGLVNEIVVRLGREELVREVVVKATRNGSRQPAELIESE